MPFLFDRNTSEDIRPKGRRAFNKKGVEVVEEVRFSSADSAAFDTFIQPKVEENSSRSQPMDPESVQDRSQKYKRPATISGSSEGAKSKKTRTVKEMIHDNSGVGTDLRSTSNARPSQSTSLANIFLKPSGVDEPLDNTRSRAHANHLTTDRTAKRGRAATSELADEGEKRKKKIKIKKSSVV